MLLCLGGWGMAREVGREGIGGLGTEEFGLCGV